MKGLAPAGWEVDILCLYWLDMVGNRLSSGVLWCQGPKGLPVEAPTRPCSW